MSTDRAGLALGGLTNHPHAAAVKDCCVNHTSANISTDIKLSRGFSAIAGALVVFVSFTLCFFGISYSQFCFIGSFC